MGGWPSDRLLDLAQIILSELELRSQLLVKSSFLPMDPLWMVVLEIAVQSLAILIFVNKVLHDVHLYGTFF
jgi:hypothetical protein